MSSEPTIASNSVSLSWLLRILSNSSYLGLQQLSGTLQTKTSSERKSALTDYLQKTRNHFIKLLVLVKWANTVDNNLKKCWEILEFVEKQDSYFRDTADSLYYAHNRLQTARAPIYDIPSAIDVLSASSYTRLPTVIENCITPPAITEPEIHSALQQLNEVVHLRLFATTVPSCYTSIHIANGRAICQVKDEFEISLTLEGEKLSNPWRVLSLQVFIAGEDDATQMTPSQLAKLRELLQRRILVADNPLVECYQVLRILNPYSTTYTLDSFCLSLQLAILHAQALELIKDSTGLGPISVDHQGDKRLLVKYWVKSDDASTVPNLEIVLDSGKGVLIASHHPPIVDPTTGQVAVFKLSATRINIEHLLLEAIKLHIYSRLQTVYDVLMEDEANRQEDIQLSPLQQEHSKNNLRVCLVESNFLFITVDLRSGEYVLKIEPFGSSEGSLHPLQERLNRDVKEIKSIVTWLRHQKILEHYERIAYSMYLEPFSSLPIKPTASKSSVSFGSNCIFLRFPDPHSSFYLVVELDDSCQAKYHLLFTKKNTSNPSLLELEQSYPIVDFHVNVPKPEEPEKQKKRKLPRSEHDKSTDVIPLDSVVHYCRKKISRLIFVQQFEEKKIKYKQINDGSILFLAACKPLNIKTMTLLLNDEFWEVKVVESETRSSDFDSSKEVQKQRGLNSTKITYSSAHHCWHFTYLGLPSYQSLDTFLQDLNGVAACIELQQQLTKLLESPMRRYFRLESASPIHISFQFDYSKTISTPVTIVWKNDRFSLMLKHPLVHYFENQLNAEKSIKTLLEMLLCSKPIQDIYAMFFTVSSEHSALHDVHVLPGDFTIIPKFASQIKLIYRNVYPYVVTFAADVLCYAIDIKFINEEFVIIEDSGTHTIPPPHFTSFLHKISENSFDAIINNQMAQISHNSVIPTLKMFHNFVGALFLFKQANQIISAESERDATIKKNLKLEKLELFFTIKNIDYCLFIQNCGTLEFKILNVQPDTNTDLITVDAEESFVSSESNVLITFFKEKIANAPYYKEHILSFINLLTLPLSILKEFLKIIQFEKHPPSDSTLQLEMLLSTISFTGVFLSLIHDKNNHIVRFVLQLKQMQEPSIGQEESRPPIHSFQYNYSTNKLSLYPSEDVKFSEKVKKILASDQPLSAKIQDLLSYNSAYN